MTPFQRQALFSVLGIVLVAACAWWWFDNMEKVWVACPYRSEAALKNPMLAATRLLKQHNYTVTTETTLNHALIKPLPAGTMILAENDGLVSAEQARQLLAWVRQGNTLITRPRWAGRNLAKNNGGLLPAEQDRKRGVDDQDEDGDYAEDGNDAANSSAARKPRPLVETDPIGAYLGVVLVLAPVRAGLETPTAKTKSKQPAPRPLGITLPNASYPLQLHAGPAYLQSTPKKDLPPLFSDDQAIALRAYAEGKGHIVLLADNYFHNRQMQRHDHAELLLALTRLRPSAANVVIVQRLSVLAWYDALWANFKLAIISASCGLLLLFWLAVPRFGPVLPEPSQDRRALMEHIDASGRWLWKVPGGRDLLLATARGYTEKILQRRAPELQRMAPPQQVAYLAKACSLPIRHLMAALQQPAAQLPLDFTRQIQTLQQLRKHYER